MTRDIVQACLGVGLQGDTRRPRWSAIAQACGLQLRLVKNEFLRIGRRLGIGQVIENAQVGPGVGETVIRGQRGSKVYVKRALKAE